MQVSQPTLEEAIRGFRVVKQDTLELVFDKPGDYVIPEAPPAPKEADLDMVGAAAQPPAAAAAAEGVAVAEPAEQVSGGGGVQQAVTSEGGRGDSQGGSGGQAIAAVGGYSAGVVEAAQADIFGA
jgi:UDP-sugar pyrophosphorylase